MKTAFLFPGQGAQFVGMGADVAKSYESAASTFTKADKIIGYNLSRICFEGPAEELNSTAISQPAIFTTTAVILDILKAEKPQIFERLDVTAGLSLGEYTALYAAGVLSFEDALILVNKRGQAMQDAADAAEGAMISIIGLDENLVHQVCEEALQLCSEDLENQEESDESADTTEEQYPEFLVPANFNCPGQIVISGTKKACRHAKEVAIKHGAIKVVRLDVAGAFHTKMMDSAADKLNQALQSSNIAEPSKIKIIANISAGYYKNSRDIIEGLTKQLTSPILWQKCMERFLADGVEEFYEIGPGRVLTGLMKRINRKINVINISTAQSLNEIIKS